MIHISLAGHPAIRNGPMRVDKRHLGGPQAHIAFAVLVLGRHRGVHRDELADAIWPGQLPATWQPALRVIISRVRAFLAAAGLAPSSALASASGNYRLELPANAVVDVEAAAEAIAESERTIRLNDWSAAERHADQARDALVTPFLAGCDGPWVIHERERLQRLRVRALEIISVAALADGRPADAIAAAGEAIRQEPYRESAHRILIESHMAAGQKAEAHSAYARCRQLLVDHLGVDPSPDTDALYRRLVASAGVPPGRRRHCDVMSRAWARVQAGATEIVLVRGEAGAGKSHLLAWFADVARSDRALVLTDGLPRGEAAAADEFVAWLIGRASDGPVVTVVDDLHEAGAPALRVLQLLARAPRSHPVLLVAAYRDAALAPDHPALSIGRRDGAAVTRIMLEPLAETDIAELAEAIGADADAARVRDVRHDSGGNVRLAAELLRSGAPATDPAIVAVVDRHLAGLSRESLQLLETAARVGQQFEVRTVQEGLALDEDTVLDALDELIAARLTTPVPRKADTCVFTHPIVRSVLVARAAT